MNVRCCASILLAGALASCSPTSPDNPDASPVDAGPSWKVVVEHLDSTLLSIWGTSATDVWAVGGPRGNGFDTLVLHFDGAVWHQLEPGGMDTYWWVYGTGPSDVWMVGESGRITHYDGSAFKEYPRVTTATLFGVWAASPTDAWAVGGTPEGGTAAPNDLLFHWDGAAWTPSPLPKALGRTLFKVWGTGSDNLYIVGEAGTVWHRVGATWTQETAPAHGTLLTVFGCSASEVYAVGGRDVLLSNGAAWSAVNVTLVNDVSGVSCAAPGQVVIVGSGGAKQRLVMGAWQDDFGTVPYTDLHGAWADASGGYWAVGGNFVAGAQPGVSRQGVIAYYGAGTVPGKVAP